MSGKRLVLIGRELISEGEFEDAVLLTRAKVIAAFQKWWLELFSEEIDITVRPAKNGLPLSPRERKRLYPTHVEEVASHAPDR